MADLVPLNAIFSTDFVAILVPVTTANTMDEVAAAVEELGMRGVLAHAYFDGGTGRRRAVADGEEFITRWRGHPR